MENVVRGKLMLKGGSTLGKKKKKKTKKLRNEAEAALSLATEVEAQKDDEGVEGNRQGAEKVEDRRTPAEKRFEEIQRQREEEKVRRLAAKTHKDRVKEFNEKLMELSEHYDIPKVGPG